jgi:hypothetical protein
MIAKELDVFVSDKASDSSFVRDLQPKNTHHAQTSRQFRFVAHTGQIGLRSSSHDEVVVIIVFKLTVPYPALVWFTGSIRYDQSRMSRETGQ